jgi:transcriptional regulator with GAF, ATPase, and Fis domain
MSFILKISGPGMEGRAFHHSDRRAVIGSIGSAADIRFEIPGLSGRFFCLEKTSEEIELLPEPGVVLAIEGREIKRRKVPLFPGQTIYLDKLRIEVEWVPDGDEVTSWDPNMLSSGQEEVRDWFETFMGLVDKMEGLRDLAGLAEVLTKGVLKTTGAERCYLELDNEPGEAEKWYRSTIGGEQPFGVSRSLISRVRGDKGIVFVPESSADPTVAGLLSVKREGISSSVAVPIHALGKDLGVLYVDCISPGRSLGPEDFRKTALLGRIFASAVGNRNLLRSVLLEGELPLGLKSRSPSCKEMIEKSRLYSQTDYTILIRGETGAGKDVVARAIHSISGRSEGPFVPVNCAAIPAQLMESELFGHVKGSFTGADLDREGFFVAANRGTLFLDEIGDMDKELQSKILRVLETREVTPVGATKSLPVDVRILAATHRDLEGMMRDGGFREDLYFRIRELEIIVPPLRERKEDLLDLAEQFLQEAASELGLLVPSLSKDAQELILGHSWRGNVRELKHAMRIASLRSGGREILAHDLELSGMGSPTTPEEAVSEESSVPPGGWKKKLEEQEIEALRKTLEESKGNLTRAAALFGLPRTTYREKLIKYGLLP